MVPGFSPHQVAPVGQLPVLLAPPLPLSPWFPGIVHLPGPLLPPRFGNLPPPPADQPSHAPAAWNRLPIRKPTPAAPRPITSIFSPLLRQSPTSVTAE